MSVTDVWAKSLGLMAAIFLGSLVLMMLASALGSPGVFMLGLVVLIGYLGVKFAKEA